ncbi:phasin family protein [Phenylobacterium sp. LjRoot219]|uniref:phasin family protein n=1 Tax=Phenylobacterium sp. LjRoot219 TaxID=3342283 RepID=UPI003ECC26A1
MADDPRIPENTPGSNDGHDAVHAKAALFASTSADTVAQQVLESDHATEAAAGAVAERATGTISAAETLADKTVAASRAAVEANTEILRDQVEAAQQATQVGLEAGMRSIEGLTRKVKGVFAEAKPNPDLAEQSARNIQEVSQACTALAKGAQEASRAWLSLTQQTVRTNLEAMAGLARCRSVQDLITLESSLFRDNLQLAVESAEVIARAQTDAIHEAALVFQQPPVQPRA